MNLQWRQRADVAAWAAAAVTASTEAQKREAETQKNEAQTLLEQQENELRQLLELARTQHEQDLLACEAVNMDLQGKLAHVARGVVVFHRISSFVVLKVCS